MITLAWIKKQFLPALAACFSWLLAGLMMAWSSAGIPSLIIEEPELEIGTTEESLIGSLVTLGALIGGLIGGPTMHFIGEKRTMLFVQTPGFIIGFVCLSVYPSLPLIYVGRIIGGIVVGISTVVIPTYISETILPQYRGGLGSMAQLFICIGNLLSYTMGAFLQWNILSAASAAFIPVFFILVVIFTPESPTHLLSKGKQEEALKSLKRLRMDQSNVETELKETLKHIEDDRQHKVDVKSLLKRRSFTRPMILALSLMFFQQFCAINIVILNTVLIFESAGSDLDGNTATIIVGAVLAVATVVSCLLVDKAGRRILLMISGLGMAISLAGLGAYFYLKDHTSTEISDWSWLPVTSLSLYTAFFSIGFGPIPWVFMSEVFSHRVRNVASGFATAFNWFCAFATTLSYSPLKELMGNDGVFWMYGAINAVGVVFVFFLVPETKGKTSREMHAFFDGKKHDKHSQSSISSASSHISEP